MDVFKKVYLDHGFVESLDDILFKDGFITHDQYVEEHFPYGKQRRRNMLRSRTLLLLTLFEEIDSGEVGDHYGCLVDEGIIAPTAHMTSRFFQVNGLYDDLMALSIASNFLRQFKRNVIEHHISVSPPNFYMKSSKASHKFAQHHVRYPMDYFKSDWGKIDKNDIIEKYDELLEYILKNDDYPKFYDGSDYVKFDPFWALGEQMWRIMAGLQFSSHMAINHGNSFANSFAASKKQIPAHSQKQAVSDLLYLVQTNFDNEIKFLPEPKSISDVVKMRNDKNLVRFREVVSGWCSAIKDGDKSLERNIRKDISKANRGIKRVQKWREYERSPLNFWLSAIGSHIPIFSNILSIVNSVGKISVDYKEKKDSWTMLLQQTN